MTDDELMQAFAAGIEPPGGLHHEQHVRAAWNFLRQSPLPVALQQFTAALRHFATANGAPQRYHETITTAYVLLINERLSDDRELPWEAFAARNQDLLTWRPSILERYYRPETLASDRARHTFVMPDAVTAAPSRV